MLQSQRGPARDRSRHENKENYLCVDTTTITNTTMSNEETAHPSDRASPGTASEANEGTVVTASVSPIGAGATAGAEDEAEDELTGSDRASVAVTSDPDSAARCSAGGPRSDEVM
jgi:hypothetical protein